MAFSSCRVAGRSDSEKAARFLVGLTPAMLHRSYLVDRSRVDFAAQRILQRRPPQGLAADAGDHRRSLRLVPVDVGARAVRVREVDEVHDDDALAVAIAFEDEREHVRPDHVRGDHQSEQQHREKCEKAEQAPIHSPSRFTLFCSPDPSQPEEGRDVTENVIAQGCLARARRFGYAAPPREQSERSHEEGR